MPISLPKPIASYFAEEQAEDASALDRCFWAEGAVRVEGGTFTGRAAIERWNADARAKYHHRVAPLSVSEGEGAIVVLARVSGDFPGSPVELSHIFRLDGEEIASLEIR